MTDTNDDKDDQVTLLDIKENLEYYSPKRLKSLIIVLINTINYLTQDKGNLKEDLDKYEEEMIELSVQVTELTKENTKMKKDFEE